MLQPRRVQLLPVPATKDNTEKNVEFAPTVRINIKLEEPNDFTNPEHSYVDLIDNKNAENDPFVEEERKEMEKLQKIAEGLDAKYGSNQKSKKRKRNLRDMVDMGEGYLEDSFVDNSEAYDEVVPWCLDTKLGGFYINEGVLDFVKNEDSLEDEDLQPKKKKEKLDENTEDIKKKVKTTDMKKPRPKKKFNTDTEEQQKIVDHTKSNQPIGPATPTTTLPMEQKKVKDTGNDQLEQSFVEGEVSELEESFCKNDEVNEDPTIANMIENLTGEVIQKVNNAKSTPTGQSTTPGENQPPQIFNTNLLEMLARLHSLCQTRKQEEKQSVFEKVALVCNCQKEQLYKKIKRYRMNVITEKINKCKMTLKDALGIVMPPLMDKYKHDLDESNKLKNELKGLMMKESHGSGDSDAEEEGRQDTERAEKVKRIMAPRRKFVWTIELRKLLCELVSLKMQHFDMGKIKSQTPEEHLKIFLDTDIRTLWPPGWIQTRALFKESKPAHQNWTCDQSRPKKAGNASIANSSGINQRPSIPQLVSQQQPQQRQQPGSSQKSPITVQNTAKSQEDPIVINLDESDNESKIPATHVNQKIQASKNVFTMLKEKPIAEAGKGEAKLEKSDQPNEVPINMKLSPKSQDHKEAEPVSASPSQSSTTIQQSTTNNQPQHSRDYSSQPCSVQKANVIGQESANKFSAPINLQTSESKESQKQEIAFLGKIVTLNQTLAQSSVSQNNSNRGKTPASVSSNLENYGNIFAGFQAAVSQMDFANEITQQQQQRKKTGLHSTNFMDATPVTMQSCVSETSTTQHASAQSSPTTKNLSYIETSPQKQMHKNVSIYHQLQQQLLQQQYQQYQQQQQQRQQQMMRKSPKHENQSTAQQLKTNLTTSPANFTSIQQSSNSSGANVVSSAKSLQGSFKETQQPSTPVKATTSSDKDPSLVQDQQQGSRIRSTDVPVPRNFQSSSYAPTPNDSNLIRDIVSGSQKSPVRKDSQLPQQQYSLFQQQNATMQQKQQQGFTSPTTPKHQQNVVNQQAQQTFRPQQQIVHGNVASQQKQHLNLPLQHGQQQVQNASQQLHKVQQHYPQHFFQNPPYVQESTQQKK